MAGAVDGWPATPVVAWIKKVSQRKAPGAMRAIALLVNPVRPRVDFICGGFCSGMSNLLDMDFVYLLPATSPGN